MNKKQKIILICVAVIAVIMLLFPPFHIVAMRGTINRGYGFIFAPPDNNAVVDTGMLSIQFLVALIVGGVALIFAYSKSTAGLKMPSLKFRHRKLIILSVIVIALVTLWIVYDPINLWVAYETKKDFLFDEAVGRENHEFNSTTFDLQPVPPLQAGYKQDFPTYMAKYGLHFEDYYNKDGNFSPKGSHWETWGTKARIVAAINWGDENLSAYQILHVIDCVNEHIKQYDPSKPIVPVIRICAEKPQAKLDFSNQATSSALPPLPPGAKLDPIPVPDWIQKPVPPPPPGYHPIKVTPDGDNPSTIPDWAKPKIDFTPNAATSPNN